MSYTLQVQPYALELYLSSISSVSLRMHRMHRIRTMDFHLLERQMFPAAGGFSFLVFDCEGCACSFFSDYPPETLTHVRGIIMEEDMPRRCNYTRLHALLDAANMSSTVQWSRRSDHAIMSTVHRRSDQHAVFIRAPPTQQSL